MEALVQLRVLDTKLSQVEESLKKASVYLAVTADQISDLKTTNQQMQTDLQVYDRKTHRLTEQLN